MLTYKAPTGQVHLELFKNLYKKSLMINLTVYL
jgi:hypothetical protein